MEINAACIRRAPDCDMSDDNLYFHNPFQPHLLTPSCNCKPEVHIQNSEAPLNLTHPSFRFEHGQITPPLDSDENLNQRGPSYFPHTSLNTISAGTHNGPSHDAVTRQWLGNISSPTQEMDTADLNDNRSQKADMKNCQARANKGVRSDTQNLRASTDAGVMCHATEAKVNCGLAVHLHDLRL